MQRDATITNGIHQQQMQEYSTTTITNDDSMCIRMCLMPRKPLIVGFQLQQSYSAPNPNLFTNPVSSPLFHARVIDLLPNLNNFGSKDASFIKFIYLEACVLVADDSQN